MCRLRYELFYVRIALHVSYEGSFQFSPIIHYHNMTIHCNLFSFQCWFIEMIIYILVVSYLPLPITMCSGSTSEPSLEISSGVPVLFDLVYCFQNHTTACALCLWIPLDLKTVISAKYALLASYRFPQLCLFILLILLLPSVWNIRLFYAVFYNKVLPWSVG